MGIFFNSPTLVCFLLLISFYSAKSEEAGNNYGDGSTVPSPTACDNCTICQYPCHPQPPPPASDTAPPPPRVGQVNCPPAAPVVCCGGGEYYAPPAPFYYPYNNYSGAAVKLLQLPALIGPSYCYVATWALAISLYYLLLLM